MLALRVGAEHPRGPGVGAAQALEDLDQRGLASPVRTQDAEELPLVNFER
jgi:hypothetical protein